MVREKKKTKELLAYFYVYLSNNIFYYSLKNELRMKNSPLSIFVPKENPKKECNNIWVLKKSS